MKPYLPYAEHKFGYCTLWKYVGLRVSWCVHFRQDKPLSTFFSCRNTADVFQGESEVYVYKTDLPISQVVPSHPGGHVHEYWFCPLLHVAPFWQGFDWHSFISNKVERKTKHQLLSHCASRSVLV